MAQLITPQLCIARYWPQYNLLSSLSFFVGLLFVLFDYFWGVFVFCRFVMFLLCLMLVVLLIGVSVWRMVSYMCLFGYHDSHIMRKNG